MRSRRGSATGKESAWPAVGSDRVARTARAGSSSPTESCQSACKPSVRPGILIRASRTTGSGTCSGTARRDGGWDTSAESSSRGRASERSSGRRTARGHHAVRASDRSGSHPQYSRRRSMWRPLRPEPCPRPGRCLLSGSEPPAERRRKSVRPGKSAPSQLRCWNMSRFLVGSAVGAEGQALED